MSELGVFAVDRGIFDHPLLTTGEAFSRREAWLWMVAEAAWKPRKVNRNGTVFSLERGQFAHSVRFMAHAWGWSKSSVDRFLTRLKTGTMIETAGGTASLLVTICNYDVYQRVALPDRDTLRDTNRDTTGTPAGQTRNIQNIQEDTLSDPSASDSKPVKVKKAKGGYTTEFETFWTSYPSTEGQSKPNGFSAWQKLSQADQSAALASLPAYAGLLKREDGRKVKHVQGYLNGRMFETMGKGAVTELETPVLWTKRLTHARDRHEWFPDKWGPLPGAAGCRVPPDLIQLGDGDGWNTRKAA